MRPKVWSIWLLTVNGIAECGAAFFYMADTGWGALVAVIGLLQLFASFVTATGSLIDGDF